jgi:hypothetical protein
MENRVKRQEQSKAADKREERATRFAHLAVTEAGLLEPVGGLNPVPDTFDNVADSDARRDMILSMMGIDSSRFTLGRRPASVNNLVGDVAANPLLSIPDLDVPAYPGEIGACPLRVPGDIQEGVHSRVAVYFGDLNTWCEGYCRKRDGRKKTQNNVEIYYEEDGRGYEFLFSKSNYGKLWVIPFSTYSSPAAAGASGGRGRRPRAVG